MVWSKYGVKNFKFRQRVIDTVPALSRISSRIGRPWKAALYKGVQSFLSVRLIFAPALIRI